VLAPKLINLPYKTPLLTKSKQEKTVVVVRVGKIVISVIATTEYNDEILSSPHRRYKRFLLYLNSKIEKKCHVLLALLWLLLFVRKYLIFHDEKTDFLTWRGFLECTLRAILTESVRDTRRDIGVAGSVAQAGSFSRHPPKINLTVSLFFNS